MKKLTAILVVMAILVTMGTTAFAEIDTTMPFIFKTAKATPTIDGVRDEAYGASDAIDIKQYGLSDSFIEGHATAQLWTLWDDNFIYFYAEMNDPTPSNQYFEGMSGWMIDGVEIYVDCANIKTDSSARIQDQELTAKYRFYRTPTRNGYDISCPMGMELGDKVQYKTVDNGVDGYIVEAAIPVRDLSGKIGFCFQINDDMNDDQLRDISVFTKDAGYLACQFNYVFDTLELEGCTATNGYEDDFIEYLTLEDLATLNSAELQPEPMEPVESDEPIDEPADEPTDEPTDEPADEPADNEPKDNAGVNPIIWVVVGVVAVVAVVIVVVVATKKKK